MASITGLSVVSLDILYTLKGRVCSLQADVEPMLQPGRNCITITQILKIQ